MNYRHAYHAGNFADVVKHAVLCRVLTHLREKPAAFRVIDTHAGAGLYDLTGDEASRGGEWYDGIARLMGAQLPEKAAALLAPYLDVIGALNERDRLKIYPGSPAIVRAWLRPQDRLIACELEPKAAVALSHNLRGDTRIKTLEIDGWTALAAYVPPPATADDYIVLPEIISKEPLAPAVRHGDNQFADIVRWSQYAMLEAEEAGIDSKNVDDMLKSDNPNIKRILGVTPGMGKALGVDEKWVYNIVKQVGNYGESFERNVGMGSALKIERGLNKLWTQGGLQYAPPIR